MDIFVPLLFWSILLIIVFWPYIVFIFHLALIIVPAFVIYKNWETFVRWYYLLTPHPASKMVRTAVRAGVEIDGDAFNEILRPAPGGRIEKEVRAEQAAKLAELAHQNTAELQRRAEETRRRIREEAAYQAANRHLHDAAVEQQLAQKRAEAFAKVEELIKQGRQP